MRNLLLILLLFPLFAYPQGKEIKTLPTSSSVDANTYFIGQQYSSGSFGNAVKIPASQVLSYIASTSGVSSFNTRTGIVTLISADVTGALGFTPVTNARTLSINGSTPVDLTANRVFTVTANAAMPTTFNGLIKGNGTSLSVAVAGTDYQAVLSGTGIVKSTSGTISYISGSSGSFVKADGSLDASVYLTSNQPITINGDASGTGSTSITLTIGSLKVLTGMINTNAVTYAKMQQASTVTLLGNPTGGTANISEITLGSGLSFSGTTLVATGSGGTVTSIATSSPITGGTITGTGTIGINDAAADAITKGAATFLAADFNSSSGLISIDYTNGQSSSGSNKGFLTSADWTTFNNKQSALTFSTGLTNSSGTVTANLSTGVSGGQTAIGGTGATDILTWKSTTGNQTSGNSYLWTGGNNGATTLLAMSFDGNLTPKDGANIILSTGTGMKIGTSTSQKLGFFNSTPVVQQTGNLVTALSNLGLVTSGTLTASNITDLATATVTFTNKRNTPRDGSTTSSATPTINTDNVDQYRITALSTAITSFTTNLSGTPTEGQILVIEITDNGTARAITWGSSFENGGLVNLPTTTVVSTLLGVVLKWNSATSKWRCAKTY